MLERIPYYIMATAHHSLSAEEKYFLIRALHLYGFSVINRPVAELEVVMGLSDSVLKRAREQLVKKALLVEVPGVAKEEEGRHAGGRPPKAFRVSEACFEWLRQGRSDKQRGRQEELAQQLMVSRHLDKLGHLLFWGRRFGEGNDLLEVATVTGKLMRYGRSRLPSFLFALRTNFSLSTTPFAWAIGSTSRQLDTCAGKCRQWLGLWTLP